MITTALLLSRRHGERTDEVKCILMASEQLSLKRFKIRPFLFYSQPQVFLKKKRERERREKELHAF